MAFKPEKNRKYYHKCSNNFAADCNKPNINQICIKENAYTKSDFKKDHEIPVTCPLINIFALSDELPQKRLITMHA